MTQQHYDNQSKTLISSGLETWVNPDTGEAREFQTIEKKVYGQRHFWKMYMFDFLAVLGIVESKQLDVIAYIMENTSPYDNVFYGTYESIADGAGVSRGTAYTAIQKLVAANFMVKIHNSVYRINPSVMVKGSEQKKRSLVIEYTLEKDTAEDSKQLPSPNADNDGEKGDLEE